MSVQIAVGDSPTGYIQLYTADLVPLGRGIEFMDPLDSTRQAIPAGVLQEIMKNSRILHGQSAANIAAVAASADGQFSALLTHLIQISSHKRLQSQTLIFLLRCVTVSDEDKLRLIHEVLPVRGKEVKATLLLACRSAVDLPFRQEVEAVCSAQ